MNMEIILFAIVFIILVLIIKKIMGFALKFVGIAIAAFFALIVMGLLL